MEADTSSNSSVETPVGKAGKSGAGKNAKRPCSEKQLANLRAGMEILKVNREKKAKEKAERKVAGLPEPPKPVKVLVEPPVKEKVRYITRDRQERTSNHVTREEFQQIKDLLVKDKAPVTEVVKEKEVIKEVLVHKDRVVSGSSMLDAIFFPKK
jgi:membrane-associated protease RseP (regulator of RpoE activity)